MSDNKIEETRIITKVNSKGVKRKRKKCRPGFQLKGGKCVPMSGVEKASKKRAIRKSVRTKKAGGESLRRRSNKKRLKALKKRKSFGLK